MDATSSGVVYFGSGRVAHGGTHLHVFHFFQDAFLRSMVRTGPRTGCLVGIMSSKNRFFLKTSNYIVWVNMSLKMIDFAFLKTACEITRIRQQLSHFSPVPLISLASRVKSPPRTCPGQGKASTIIFPAELTSAKPLKVTASANPKLFHK